MIAQSADRVSLHDSPSVSAKLRQRLDRSVAYHTSHPEAIDARLRELDREWDVERVLQTQSSALTLLGLAMGVLRRRRWLLLPVLVQGFFLQHALQGWCPPLPLLRALGFRTAAEIEEERHALEALAGDDTPKRRRHAPNGRNRSR